MEHDEVQEQMLKSPVGQAVNAALEAVRAIKDEVDHPEGIILIASVKIPGDDERMAGGVCIVGCNRGLENTLLNAALEHPSFGRTIRKIAKILKKREKGEDDGLEDLPPELRNLFRKLGGKAMSLDLDLSTKIMEKSAERLLDTIKNESPEEQKRHVEMIKKDICHPGYPRNEGETMVEYITRVTRGDVPPNLKALTQFVDNYKTEE